MSLIVLMQRPHDEWRLLLERLPGRAGQEQVSTLRLAKIKADGAWRETEPISPWAWDEELAVVAVEQHLVALEQLQSEQGW